MQTNAKRPEFDTMTDEGEAAYLDWFASIGNADWKENPQSVLESVDAMLAQHGLEVRLFECDGDSYEFDIVKREA